jgi:hypothetical protein
LFRHPSQHLFYHIPKHQHKITKFFYLYILKKEYCLKSIIWVKNQATFICITCLANNWFDLIFFLGHTMGAFLILTCEFLLHLILTCFLIVWFEGNIADVFEVVGSFGGQILVNSYYAVDTFFFQSGLLLSFLWFRAYSRNPKRVTSLSSWAMFYVHRVLRLFFLYWLLISTFVFKTVTCLFYGHCILHICLYTLCCATPIVFRIAWSNGRMQDQVLVQFLVCE